MTSVFSVVNGADGISDIEGEAATGSGERGGSRASFKSVVVWRPSNYCLLVFIFATGRMRPTADVVNLVHASILL